jgi:hypothetical protein
MCIGTMRIVLAIYPEVVFQAVNECEHGTNVMLTFNKLHAAVYTCDMELTDCTHTIVYAM